MIEMTTADIAGVVAGQLEGPAQTMVSAEAFVDSRHPVVGGLYLAIKGDRVDGHDYARAAVEAGAAAVVSQRPLGLPGVVVADPVEAAGFLAHHVITQLATSQPNSSPLNVSGSPSDTRTDGLIVVGVTGSQGKTSCKDLLGQLLERVGETVATVGSLNNEIGVPLTALRATEHTRFLVSEMGARGIGHIRYLASMVRPLVAVVLNVGVAHIGEFGSRESIATAKGELVEALPPTGVAVLNADDPLVLAMATRTPARVLTFGTGAEADVRYQDVRLDQAGQPCLTLSYRGSSRRLTLPLVGAHQATNAAAAAAAAFACGMSFDQVVDALGAARTRSHWRMEVTTSASGVTVVNDAYNANPDSMRAAVSTLASLARRPGAGRTFAVLGEMRELGASADTEHAAVGRQVARLGISRLVVVGEQARAIQQGAAEQPGWDGEAVMVEDQAAATAYLRREAKPGDLVLVKASRASGLETVAMALLDEDVPT